MNEIQLHKMQEDEAFGGWLMDTVAKYYGVPSNERAISRAVYKHTGCGAWIKFDERGIVLGTIVEWSDAEYSERVSLSGLMDLDEEESEKLLMDRIFSGLENCERFADEVWSEMEGD